jgi:transglycosylase-like protein
MQASTKLSLAAIVAVAVTAPVGIALAADGHDPAQAQPVPLAAPLAGHRSVDGQMHRTATVLRRHARHRAAARAIHIPPLLRRIAECESHGNPRSIGGGGAYRGMFQFSQDTWNSVGGHGDPVKATVGEQVRRAEILLARSGPGQWPVCSQ